LTMVTMFVRHTVEDYGNWKRIYDGLAPVRKRMGVTSAAVYRDAHDANTTTVTHQFKDMETATAFAHSDELKSAMALAGVSGPPEIWFTQDIETTAY
jgi:quinol monooxygenase YgiN